MKSVLITGCNRGLGLEFVKQLVKQQNPPAKIIATCRSLEKAQVNNISYVTHVWYLCMYVM
jgi:NAD(P)-dependent dehydrogenase (short-subunit alcohol dehydrogenase family)